MSESLDTITQNWNYLMNVKEVTELGKYLIKKGKFTQEKIDNIFSTDDEHHNKRMFFFAIQEKYHLVVNAVAEWLIDRGERRLAEAISPQRSGCKLFRPPIDNEEDKEESELSSSIEEDAKGIPIDNNITPLNIIVKLASEFSDTTERNPNVPYYSSRSKQRGRILIINNFDFSGTLLKYRTGATVDERNLFRVFAQMGGWVIESHQNKTAEEMRLILKDFVEYREEKVCDVSIVFVMSHGSEQLNKTIIYGRDARYIYTSEVQEYFSPSKCLLYRGKPKIFIYQVCRGNDKDLPIHHSSSTEVDSMFSMPSTSSQSTTSPVITVYRSTEDILIGYATLHGSKAHRDPFRGTWYIELICQHFMNLAQHESVDHLLMKVDEGLRGRKSEYHTMQTSETRNKGFKKLYLNPGIYEENGELKMF